MLPNMLPWVLRMRLLVFAGSNLSVTLQPSGFAAGATETCGTEPSGQHTPEALKSVDSFACGSTNRLPLNGQMSAPIQGADEEHNKGHAQPNR